MRLPDFPQQSSNPDCATSLKIRQIVLGLDESCETFERQETISGLKNFWTMGAPVQLPPEGDWLIWLFLGGRGAGKTRAGAEWVTQKVAEGARRIALVAPTFNDVREVMIEGPSGLLGRGHWKDPPRYEASRKRVVWENGAVAYAFSAEDPDGLRGPQFDLAWGDAAISAVAIDWYVPLGNWREGEDHLDRALARSPHDRDYLTSQIEGGEGYDWYYASEADRAVQLRTPISDGAGEAWIWRYKDLRSWWSNAHHDRPGGVRQAEPTGWVPQGKPLWLTEVGCPAVDKGANRPNVFLDPKSAESDLPWHSTGVRDDLIQRRYVEAITGYWDAAENNPVSAVYGGPMVDPDLVHVWAFDARPWPDFPAREDVWSDGENWRRGHWLNGRAGQVPVAVIAQELAAGAGLEALDVSALDDLVPGYLVERPMPVRAALAPLLGVLGVSAWNRAEALVLASAGAPERVMELDDPVADAAGEVRLSDADPAGLPGDVRLRFFDEAQDYRPGLAQARDTFGTSGSRDLSASLVADVALARTWCAGVLEDAAQGARTLGLTLPTAFLALEPGDGVRFGDAVWCLQAVTGEMGGEAVLKRPTGRRASIQGTDGAVAAGLEAPSRPLVQVLDVPAAAGCRV